MPLLSITIREKGFDKLIKAIEVKEENLREEVISLGKQARDVMRSNIGQSVRRHPSTGKLGNSIDTEVIQQPSLRVGVGRITNLPIYWHVVNFGAKVTGEAFFPGGGKRVAGDFGGSRPESTSTGSLRMNHPGNFLVQAKKPIAPMNYIEKTANWLTGIWIERLRQAFKK